MSRVVDLVALALGAGSMFALGYAVNDVSNGVAEAPQHWWSTAPLLGLGLAVALWAAPRGRRLLVSVSR